MEEREEAIQDLNATYGMELSPRMSAVELEEVLAVRLNRMIREEFPVLIQLLYQLDVSEEKLRGMLQAKSGDNAGLIIARLVIQRVLQKVATRRVYRGRKDDECEEERW